MPSGTEWLRRLARIDPKELVMPLVVFLAVMALGYLVRRIFLGALRAWNERSKSLLGRILLEALRGPTLIWILILAVHLAIESSVLPDVITVRWGPRVLIALWIASLTLMSMRVAGDIVRHYGAQIPGALPVTTLTQTLAQLAVLVLGLMLLLSAEDVRITPILTALGVGGLAVALALQDTLSNLFSGFYVAVARQVRLGDYIKLNSGEEGYVTDIGWRSTTIRSLANNLILVPNAKLAQAIVTNYYLPEKRMSSSLQVGVSYDSDPELVEHVLLELVNHAAGEVPGMLAEPAPSVAFDPGFLDSALAFTVNYQVAEFANQFGVRNELRRRILRRFRAEGIDMPFPTRTVYVEERRNGNR
ncbi:MAG TPA: mechanosensitive ion channel domain-containing protein [Bryobacteraceae bacterium]|nr:mechanosensitive ion channel domain-containing protein [Bryobacteraceae bacterium]